MNIKQTQELTILDTCDLRLRYTDNMDLTLNDAMPGNSIVKAFTVENIGDKKVSYNIVWKDLINTIDNYDLHLDMKCKSYKNYGTNSQVESESCDSFYKAVPYTETSISKDIKRNNEIDTGITHEYIVTKSPCVYINDIPITHMSSMFQKSQATKIDLSGYNTKNVTSIDYMFKESKAEELDLSSLDTRKVTSTGSMSTFSNITTIDISNFDTNKVTTTERMFSNMTNLKAIYVSDKFSLDKVTSSADMFLFCKNLVGGMGTKYSLTFNDKTYTRIDGGETSLGTIRLNNIIILGIILFMLYNLSRIRKCGMKHKGFTLVELLAVIAILAILVIIALPNVINMYNSAKKQTFLTEARTIYKEAQKKYVSDSISGNKVNTISSNGNKLDLTGNKVDYYIKIDSAGNITDFKAYDGSYCISGKFNDISELNIDEVIEGECEETSPKNFSTDDWETIIDAIREGNGSEYAVGSTKEVNLGTYGTHTLRVANTSTPSECSGTGFSQSACGFVLEFADIITDHKMNDTNTNVGGWPASSMYTFVNNDIYNAIPDEIKNAIIDTTVVSGHGSTSGEENFTSTDKLYLLAPKEIYTDFNDTDDTAKDLTRTLDYYTNIRVTTRNHSGAKKKNGTNADWWWLRAAHSNASNNFYYVSSIGSYTNKIAGDINGVSPAFRIG